MANITTRQGGVNGVGGVTIKGTPLTTLEFDQNFINLNLALNTKLDTQTAITAGTFNNITVGTNGLVTGGSNTSYLIPGAAITLPNLTNALNSGNYPMYYKSNVATNGGVPPVTAYIFDTSTLDSTWDTLVSFNQNGVVQAKIDPVGGGYFNMLGQGYTQIGDSQYNAVSPTANDKLLVTAAFTGSSVRSCSITSQLSSPVVSTYVGQALNCFVRTATDSIGNFTQTTLGGSMRNRYVITHQGTGTITEASSVSANLTTSAIGSLVTSFQAFNVETGTLAGACTNFIGLHMRNNTNLTNQYGVYVDYLSGGATLNYAIYTAGATPSYFGGNITAGASLYMPTGSAIYVNNSVAVKVDSSTGGTNIGLSNTQSSSGTAVGGSNTANTATTTAIGSSNSATASSATAIGYSNNVSSVSSVAVGSSNTISGTGSSVSIGLSCIVSAASSAAMGISVNNSVANSLQIGASNTAKITILSTGLVGLNNTNPLAALDVTGDTIGLRTARTPASATAAGNAGDICWDASYVYVCVATNTWKRSSIATWP